MCRNLAKQHVDEPDVPAAPDGADGYAEWTQIALILFRVELEKSLRETEDYLNEMPGVLAVFDLDDAPHYSSFCWWKNEYRMRELRRLLPFFGRIRERHHRRHLIKGAKWYNSDPSRDTASDCYCIF
jgi:hypothetical protein